MPQTLHVPTHQRVSFRISQGTFPTGNASRKSLHAVLRGIPRNSERKRHIKDIWRHPLLLSLHGVQGRTSTSKTLHRMIRRISITANKCVWCTQLHVPVLSLGTVWKCQETSGRRLVRHVSDGCFYDAHMDGLVQWERELGYVGLGRTLVSLLV